VLTLPNPPPGQIATAARGAPSGSKSSSVPPHASSARATASDADTSRCDPPRPSAKPICVSLFTDGSEFFIWLSDDENKIPLHLESPIRVGSVNAYITGYKGLKYPLTSKIR